ncbi:Nramp family divalent metal transporter [Fulvivirgaceae bacterium BMA10]|uniref:Nramp family divalent metal transporter n=1 Tax=Splendidivirga corallicola TaxID=3051826 RepID=A0ABT8KU61_9BACT|nr:Nramp family divalent metal transporter [Fulvivirgaceae bacterium BMA10]
MTDTNPYVLNSDSIQEPPSSLKDRLKYLGPGFILSASIVGSGELIATTSLGAKAGFVTFWVIIVSCLVKVAIQVEFGKYAIYSGQTTMTAFNRLPGLKIGKAHWTIWTWLGLMIIKFLQVGGIVGGAALVLNIAFPNVPVMVWSLICALSVSLFIYKGYYKFVEQFSVVLIATFTVLTLVSVVFVQFTPYAVSPNEFLSGLTFRLPKEAVIVAFGAFGITGIGGDEIMSYNYWLIEKGYAAYTGPREETESWRNRAKGWIKIMYLDATVSMLIYTLTTAAFYLLGAAILNRQGLLPEGMELIKTLTNLYTESLGTWAYVVFLIAAFIVLYSTLFGALAIWTRLFPDAFSQIGWIDFTNTKQRKKTIAILSWSFPLIWSLLFLLMKAPALMVIIGGLTTSVILLIVVYASFYFRYKFLPGFLKPSRIYDLLFWLSVLSIIVVGSYGIYQII